MEPDIGVKGAAAPFQVRLHQIETRLGQHVASGFLLLFQLLFEQSTEYTIDLDPGSVLSKLGVCRIQFTLLLQRCRCCQTCTDAFFWLRMLLKCKLKQGFVFQ